MEASTKHPSIKNSLYSEGLTTAALEEIIGQRIPMGLFRAGISSPFLGKSMVFTWLRDSQGIPLRPHSIWLKKRTTALAKAVPTCWIWPQTATAQAIGSGTMICTPQIRHWQNCTIKVSYSMRKRDLLPMLATLWGMPHGVPTMITGVRIGERTLVLKQKMQHGQAVFVTGMPRSRHCLLAIPLPGTIKPVWKTPAAHHLRLQSLLHVLMNQATGRKESLQSSSTTKVWVSILVRCHRSSNELQNIHESNHRCSTIQWIPLTLVLTIVSKTTGGPDSADSSTFQILVIGRFTSRAMMEVRCGLTEWAWWPTMVPMVCGRYLVPGTLRLVSTISK